MLARSDHSENADLLAISMAQRDPEGEAIAFPSIPIAEISS